MGDVKEVTGELISTDRYRDYNNSIIEKVEIGKNQELDRYDMK